MGKTASKSSNEGDANVQITNMLENHEAYHEDHQFKLWLILVMVSLHTVIAVYKMMKKYHRKNAIKAAKSVADLQRV